MSDTIYALATPVGGAIAMVRVSGPDALAIMDQAFSAKAAERVMAVGALIDEGQLVDECMGVRFKGPRSYTGEDMAELYIHGGQAIARHALELLAKLGARPARPGEFTERAFLNGKMDLSQAEAVMDLVNALSDRAAASALMQLEGRLGERIRAMEETLLDALSGVDAAIDYPEELEEDVIGGLPQTLGALKAEADALVSEGIRSRALREGARVAIIGKPNAGKSSLLNAMLGEERAIVTPGAGTTRDVITEAVIIGGIPITLYDTAGLREAQDEAERIGVARAKKAASEADLLLIALDGEGPLGCEDRALIGESRERAAIGVICKGDLPLAVSAAEVEVMGLPCLIVSSVTGEGLDALKAAVAARIAPGAESALVTNARHVDALALASGALADALACLGGANGFDLDCVATDLHRALSALGAITGREVSEDVIERIFSRFCVGK